MRILSWDDEALAEPRPDVQFLNVDGRAVVLQPQPR